MIDESDKLNEECLPEEERGILDFSKAGRVARMRRPSRPHPPPVIAVDAGVVNLGELAKGGIVFAVRGAACCYTPQGEAIVLRYNTGEIAIDNQNKLKTLHYIGKRLGDEQFFVKVLEEEPYLKEKAGVLSTPNQIQDRFRNFVERIIQAEPINSLFEVFTKLSLFGTSPETENAVRANLPRIITQRIENGEIPDLHFLFNQATTVVGSDQKMMLDAYRRGVNNLINYELFCTKEEAHNEDEALGRHEAPETAMSLRTVFYMMSDPGRQSLDYLQKHAKVVVFDIGGLVPRIQEVVVRLVIDQLKQICHLQFNCSEEEKVEIPIYPSLFFEEAHMYMDSDYINELIPLIRHLGMNLFFVTNTPGALPDSVFRLVDNLIMTRMINKKDIDRVIDCGLADKKTIEGFARDLPEYHNLFLSAKNGATTNFPLVFKVRDFTAEPPEGENLPKSGVTRSMWTVVKQRVNSSDSGSKSQVIS